MYNFNIVSNMKNKKRLPYLVAKITTEKRSKKAVIVFKQN